MQYSHNHKKSPLDAMRRKSGNDRFREAFSELARSDKAKAVALLEHTQLQFGTLYILSSEIEDWHIYAALGQRNRIALSFCYRTLCPASQYPDGIETISPGDEPTHETLKWMLITGAGEDGLCDGFDQMLDTSALLLIRTYHDAEILPQVVQMIFRRNRKGYYYHDLAWALFASRDPRILGWIASYLRSEHSRDVQLAQKLLRHGPQEENNARKSGKKQYASYISWLKENQPYLFFTGEGFQQSSEPSPCRLDLRAKYLCREVGPNSRGPMDFPSETDSSRLREFSHAPEDDRRMLAKYSHRLYHRNKTHWNTWIAYPIDKQITIARSRLGGKG